MKFFFIYFLLFFSGTYSLAQAIEKPLSGKLMRVVHAAAIRNLDALQQNLILLGDSIERANGNSEYFEEILSEFEFLRISKKNIINIKQIQRINKGDNATVLMKDSSTLEISRRRKPILMEMLKK